LHILFFFNNRNLFERQPWFLVTNLIDSQSFTIHNILCVSNNIQPSKTPIDNHILNRIANTISHGIVYKKHTGLAEEPFFQTRDGADFGGIAEFRENNSG
jgi:hypothetical protein